MIVFIKKFIFFFAFEALKVARGFKRNRGCIYIVAPTSAGSLGDQALMQGLVDGLSLESDDSELVEILIEEWQKPQVLKSGTLRTKRFSTQSRLTKLRFLFDALETKALVIIGADTLDGGYALRKNLAWFELADTFASLNIPTSIVSFSFSDNPVDKAIERLRKLDSRVRFISRDPVSRDRFERSTGQNCELSADLAFLVSPETSTQSIQTAASWARTQKAQGGIVMGLNVNPLGMENVREKLITSFVSAVSSLCNEYSALSLLLIPHDFRAGQSDEAILAEIQAQLPGAIGERIKLVSGPFHAWEAKVLVSNIDFLVTGRMHLGIAALGSGVPVYGFSYKGKFEGLMEHFAIKDNLLGRERASDKRVLYDFLSHAVKGYADIREVLRKALPEVKDKSMNNLMIIRNRK